MLISLIYSKATIVKISFDITILKMLTNFSLYKYLTSKIEIINYIRGTAPFPCTPP